MTSPRIQGTSTGHAAGSSAAGNTAGPLTRPPSPARPDGLPARTASGSPAQRARQLPSLAPIEQLPHEILTKILRHTLPADTPHAFVGTIAAIRIVSKSLHDGPPTDTELWFSCRALSLLGQTVTQYVDDNPHLTEDDICGLGPALGLLPPGRRARVAQAAINILADSPRALAIGGLGPGLAQLPQASRDDLFDAAADLAGDEDKAWALGGLAVGLEFLEPSEVGALVASILELPDDTANKGRAIAGLAPKLAQLPPDRRAGLVQAAIHLAYAEDRAWALAALAAELAHLNPPERDAVIHAVGHQFPEGQLQAEAIGGLCRAEEALHETQLDQLAQQVLNIEGHQARGQAIGALGTVLARLGEDRRNEVFDAATQLDDVGKCLAIQGLGAGLASLTAEQRQTLVEDTIQRPDIPEKALAIAGLAAVAAHLSDDQRGLLVEAALYLPEDARGGDAIGSLGSCLEHLHPDQREDLVAAAIACTSPDQKAGAIAGLAQGWQHLTQPQRHRLSTAAAGMEGAWQKWRAIAALAREATKPLPG